MNRRLFAALLIGGAASGAARLLAATEPGIEVSVAASRFEYTPDKVKGKVGVPLTFVLTSLDRIHGFKMPEFGIRTDIVPDKETRVTITPTKPGTFTFFCDIFCGDGHEDMAGTLVVEG
ncbi:MAG: cupredoxin domain-containing protein [Reyranella sp.]|uniref:cupredoxin domain-containing protein n=1 Tax=Reyranella sp. TaxID=1929291 RepID=UPI001AC89E25|nr:cupredoxin domain-containing protein [Reyranella sp.]MBN9091110.1 cupredoxin domain-containing protein [Reyranella sp.]